MNLYKFFQFVVIIAIPAAIIGGCYKKDSFEKIKIEGKLFLEDTILKKGVREPKSGVEVLLANTNNFSDYIFKTTTLADGSFSFSYKPVDGQPLYLLAKTTKDNIAYSVITDLSAFASGGDLVMLPKPGNGVKIIAKDPSGNALPNANICIFSGPLALGTDNCSIAIQSSPTNETGAAVFTNIPIRPEPYYVLAKANIGGIELRYTGSVVISSTGLQTKDILLTTQNGFNLTIKDNQGTPLNAADVFVYRSRAVYLIDSTNANSIKKISTTEAGKTWLYNIDAAKYYLRMVKQIGSSTLKKMDSIIVNNSGITDSTFVLQ
jgi:hypothetical protein